MFCIKHSFHNEQFRVNQLKQLQEFAIKEVFEFQFKHNLFFIYNVQFYVNQYNLMQGIAIEEFSKD